ncbi:Uncharacterised protein [uncultured archaeon]|nr:Uncharacterised protein [uncultured archaeon]
MENQNKDKDIKYTVNDKEQETDQKVMTPRAILEKAGIDPTLNYLVQIEGKKQISYKDSPDQNIEMHNNMKFISISTGPTPVS